MKTAAFKAFWDEMETLTRSQILRLMERANAIQSDRESSQALSRNEPRRCPHCQGKLVRNGSAKDSIQWLGVPVGDWATWLGVIVSVGVVIATWRAASVALNIATKDATARQRTERGRARVAAAFLYPDVVRLISHMNALRVQAFAAIPGRKCRLSIARRR